MARKWEVFRTFKALGDVRGETNENLALEAFINHVERRQSENRRAYYWLSKVRMKTPEEDHAGVDIVLETTKGNYGINVKSWFN